MAYSPRPQKRASANYERLSRVKELSVNITMKLIELATTSNIPYDQLTDKLFPTVYRRIYKELTADKENPDEEFEDEEEDYYEQPAKGRASGR